jgi:site-specific recombinase XerC
VRDFNLDVLASKTSEIVFTPPSDLEIVLPEDLPLDQNPAAVYLAMLKRNGRRPQKSALDIIAGILSGGRANCFELDWSKVRYQHTAFVRSHLMDGYAPATANRMLSALRRTLEQAWLLGQMSAEDYLRAAHISAIIGETLPAGRALSHDEISILIKNCIDDPRPIGTRDAAIVGVMYSGGLRRAEVVTLDLADYDEVDHKLKVHGKRSKERSVYLTDGAVAALDDWLKIRGNENGPLFVAINRGSNLILGERMTTQAIYYLLKSRASVQV